MISVKLQLYKHKTLKDGTHPILVQIIKDRKRKTLSLGYSATEAQWSKQQNLPNSKNPNHQLLTRLLKLKIHEIQEVILDFENKKKSFTLDDIYNKIRNKDTTETFNGYAEKLINDYSRIGKIGNAKVYSRALKSPF